MLQCKSSKYYIFRVCVCSLRQHINAYLPCSIVICGLSVSTIFFPVWLDLIFPHYHKSGKTFYWKKAIEHKICDLFSLQLLSEIFLTLIRTERDLLKNVYWSSFIKYLLFLSDFNTTWIFSIDFWQILKFHGNLSSGISVVQCGWTDRQTDRRD